jgi:hypothetical protein
VTPVFPEHDPGWLRAAANDAVSTFVESSQPEVSTPTLLEVSADGPHHMAPSPWSAAHVVDPALITLPVSGRTHLERATAVVLDSVLSLRSAAERRTIVAGAWSVVQTDGWLVVVDDFVGDGAPGTPEPLSALQLVDTVLEVSHGAATLDTVSVLRRAEDDAARWALVAVCRLA